MILFVCKRIFWVQIMKQGPEGRLFSWVFVVVARVCRALGDAYGEYLAALRPILGLGEGKPKTFLSFKMGYLFPDPAVLFQIGFTEHGFREDENLMTVSRTKYRQRAP